MHAFDDQCGAGHIIAQETKPVPLLAAPALDPSPNPRMKGFSSSSSSKDSGTYEHLTFIQEDPTLPNQRKKPRTLTACDRCRARKVKCEQSASSERCDACLLARQECSFKARDQRFHGAPPSAESTSSNPHSGMKVDDTQRPASSKGRRASTAAGPDAMTPAVAGSSRVPRPSGRFPASSTAPQHPGGISPTPSQASPPLPAAQIPPHNQFFDYPLHPTFPRRDHMSLLVPTFFEHFGAFFPYLKQADISQRASAGRLWNIHALGIAALASRFSTHPAHAAEPRFQHGSVYLSVAKPLITQYKGQMTLQALQGIILLSWAEAGGHPFEPLTMTSPTTNSTVYITEAVKIANTLGLGWRSKIDTFGVPRDEVIATWWSLMLIDELTAWNNNQSPLIHDNDFDHQLVFNPASEDDTFMQLSALSLQRRKVGRHLYTATSTMVERSSAIDGMKTTYISIRRNCPNLDLRKASLQACIRSGKGGLFMAFHLLYYSVIFGFRLFMANTGFHGSAENDAALVSARNVLEISRWCHSEKRPQDILANLFLESALYEAGQVFVAVYRAAASTDPNSGRYLQEARDCRDTLMTLGSVWPKVTPRCHALALVLDSVGATSTGLSPVLMNMNMGSMMEHQVAGYSSHIPIPPMAPSSSYTGWSHSPSASPYHAPLTYSGGSLNQGYYDPNAYIIPGGTHSRSNSPYSKPHQHSPGQSWSSHPR
ncbi:hypothetical protein PIIN_01847 [Serendipita indica DSM 11827]|uniref:Zn(2)-C6 fungal-type domain-containing protein n=1 Tax=Serendipita indica (strain DSM 11827) TaxID=1109443 RepID=G4T9H9_SERID|nr:hypothetical protein PIIN_01847 [Serendipita indica DSM 11827]